MAISPSKKGERQHVMLEAWRGSSMAAFNECDNDILDDDGNHLVRAQGEGKTFFFFFFFFWGTLFLRKTLFEKLQYLKQEQ